LSYAGTDIFLICFAIDNPRSMAYIKNKWIPELNYHAPQVPYILVGTKVDKRNEFLSSTNQVFYHKVKLLDWRLVRRNTLNVLHLHKKD
jgi:GTPase SAR1 family protein